MLTEEENKDLIGRMQNAGQHVHLTDQTRHLVIQKLLIDYIYCQRSREIEAIAVCNIVGMVYFQIICNSRSESFQRINRGDILKLVTC